MLILKTSSVSVPQCDGCDLQRRRSGRRENRHPNGLYGGGTASAAAVDKGDLLSIVKNVAFFWSRYSHFGRFCEFEDRCDVFKIAQSLAVENAKKAHLCHVTMTSGRGSRHGSLACLLELE
jgi:hypothetical protein